MQFNKFNSYTKCYFFHLTGYLKVSDATTDTEERLELNSTHGELNSEL